jgi:hypothetical protein
LQNLVSFWSTLTRCSHVSRSLYLGLVSMEESPA